VAPLSDTDALLNVQSDGTFTAAPGVVVDNLQANGGILGGAVPRVVEIDVSKLPANTLAVLSFDLIGFGHANSRVVLDNVLFDSGPPHNPVAVPDVVTVREDTPQALTVLANDTAPGSALDPKTVTVTQAPTHGTATVDPATGNVLYTPALNYVGGDSFAYRVRNVDGLLSNEAAVVVTVTPVAHVPTVSTT